MKHSENTVSPFGPVVFSYSRADAIKDGVLIDVSEIACETGIRYPVAVTTALWEQHIYPSALARAHGQSEAARLWDVLYMFKHKSMTRLIADEPFWTYFPVAFIGKHGDHETVTVKAHYGPGDDTGRVITLMLSHED